MSKSPQILPPGHSPQTSRTTVPLLVCHRKCHTSSISSFSLPSAATSSSFSLSHKISSLVPSIAFAIQHFLSEQETICWDSSSHDSSTQEETELSEGALMLPPAVKLFWTSIIHMVNVSWRRSLNGFFRLTSSGCNTLVSAPCSQARLQYKHCYFKTHLPTHQNGFENYDKVY